MARARSASFMLHCTYPIDMERDMKQFKIIVEKYPEGYVAYPAGLNGIVVGEGVRRVK